MQSLFENYLRGEFNIAQYAGSKTWVIESKSKADEKLIVNQYLKTNRKASEAHRLNQELHKINSDKTKYFVKYFSLDAFDKYIFLKIEYCPKGDLNSFIIENRYQNKAKADMMFKQWIMDLLEAIIFLDEHKFIHKRLNTYNIFLTNDDQLKIDGFEHVEWLGKSKKPIVEVKYSENYGMFNAPEIVKYGKINCKYHVWSLGWIVYEMATCDWQNFRLHGEKFDNWTIPNLPNTFSKIFNCFFKNMTKLSPGDRPSPQRLKKMLEKCLKNEIMIPKENDNDDHDFYMRLLELKYTDKYSEDDDVETLSDVGEEEKRSEADKELDFNKRKELNLVYFKEIDFKYTMKDLIAEDPDKQFDDYLVKDKASKKKRTLRNFGKNVTVTQKELDNIKKLVDATKNKKTFYVTGYFDCYSDKPNFGYVFEYFEETTLERLMNRMRTDRKQLTEDRVYDSTFYIIKGLDFLHARGIIHRDICPKNIYVRGNRMKIGNIGIESILSKQLENLKSKKSKEEESLYLSPEIVKDLTIKSIVDKSDVWAAGCILYELYHLRPLYTNKDLYTDKYYPNLPEFDPSQKIKKAFNACIETLEARLHSHKVLEIINQQINREKEIYKHFS